MIFEKQEYQQQCIDNIKEILSHFNFTKQDNLQECLQDFYQRNPMPVQDFSDKPRLDILMETGTGKTFTYLNLIFELHKSYKQNKFIIFVPRKAILESVRQNINLTKGYFYSIYDKYLRAYYYTDSKSQSTIINHYIKNDDELSVLILTNSAIDKKDNILNKKHESLFNDKSIFENIAEKRPISIIDEPHLLKGKAFNEYFHKLNSLHFRFGATFPKDDPAHALSNVAYCLDSISAFQSYLVKQIHVHTIIQNNNTPFLIDTASKPYKSATFSYFKSNVEYRETILLNGSLGTLDSSFKHLSLVNVSKGKAYLSDGTIIEKKTSYQLSQAEIEGLLARAIDLHFEKEQALFKQNIKALSLFFIPSIADFRGENPFIKTAFERLYKEKRQEILERNLDANYRAYLEKDFDEKGALKVHQGYFSGDSNLSAKKKESNKEALEANDIKLILQEKEKLLSFDTPLRFIFSVWALQEGWDNPNIFTLTKLANSSSETSRHQQVGRGLRICVDDSGRRVTHSALHYNDNDFFAINHLDMLVSSEERGFIEGLQKELIDSSFTPDAKFIHLQKLITLGLNDRQAGRLLNTLEDLNLVEYDESTHLYTITAPVYEAISDNEDLKKLLGDKFTKVLDFFKRTATAPRDQIINKNKPTECVSIKPNLAKAFKDLWHTINQKSILTYEQINETTLIESIAASFNATHIPEESIRFESKIYDAQSGKIIPSGICEVATISYTRALEKDFHTLALDFAKDNHIPLPFLIKLLNALDKRNFTHSPKAAFTLLKNLYKDKLHQNLIQQVGYEFTQSYSNSSLLYDENGQPRAEIEAQKLGRFIAKDTTPAPHYLYDKVIYDSDIEKEAIESDPATLKPQDLAAQKITVFAKLPKFSIPTPFKSYEPDFAYLLEDEGGQRIFFICETKGYDRYTNIPDLERKKIDYAKKFFKALQENLKDENITVLYSTRINKQDLLSSLKQALRSNND